MATTVTIAGVDRTSLVIFGTLFVDKDDAVETCRFEVQSNTIDAAVYRPAVGNAVRIEEDGSLIFGGEIEVVDDRATAQPDYGDTSIHVEAMGYHVLPKRLFVTATYASTDTASMAANIATLLNTYFGVTNLTPGPDGPTLPALTFDHVYAFDVLEQITKMSGYPWRINGDKEFAIGAPGVLTGPAFSDANAFAIQHFSWTKSRILRATRVWTKVGTSGSITRTETHTGNGVRVNFYLDVAPSIAPTEVIETVGGVPTTYPVPGARWGYNSTRLRLEELLGGPLAVGNTIAYTYTVDYPAWCKAETEADIDADDLFEVAYEYPDVIDLAQGVALADGHLTQQTTQPKIVTLRTREVNVYPWLKCTISFPDRTTTGDYLVRSTRISQHAKSSVTKSLLSELDLYEGTTNTSSWMDFWRQRMSLAGGSSSAAAGGSIIIQQGVKSHTWATSRSRGLRTASYANAVDYLAFVPATDQTVNVRVEVKTDAAGTSVTPRIWNQTDSSAAVTGSSSTSTSWAAQTLTFSAVANKEYRLQILGGNANASIYAVGTS